MKYPSKTSYAWISEIKTTSFWLLLLCLILFYVLINCVFADIYYFCKVLKSEASILDHFYFSFVTALTIGYGDFYPLTTVGKVVVAIHTCLTAIYFAIMVTALSAKMFYPKNTIMFSERLLFDPINKRFAIRLINTHREPLVNPEIRIFMTEHCYGNVMGPMHRITKYDDMPFLGKHDFSLFFQDKINTNAEDFRISSEWYKALSHDRGNHSQPTSRFSITISISGSYGIQQIAHYKKYYPSEIELGTSFKAIQYNDEDQRQAGNIRYSNFPDMWNDFNKIIGEE